MRAILQPKHLLLRRTSFCLDGFTRRNLPLHGLIGKERQPSLLRQVDNISSPTKYSMMYVTLPFLSLKGNAEDMVIENTLGFVKGTLIWKEEGWMNKETEHFHNVLESIPAYHRYLALFLVDEKSLSTIEQCMFDLDEMKSMSLRDKLRPLKHISCLSKEDFVAIASTGHIKTLLSDLTNSIGQMKKAELQFFSRCLGTMAHRYNLSDYGDIFLEAYDEFLRTVSDDMQQFDLETLLVVADAILLFNRNIIPRYIRYRKQNDPNKPKVHDFRQTIIYKIVNKECLELERLCYHNNQTIVLMMLLGSECRGMSFAMLQHFRSIKKRLHNVHNLSVEECAIICMGFNKTDNGIKDMAFMRLTVSKLVKNIHAVSDFTVATILKLVSRTFDKRIKEKNFDVYLNIKQLPDKVEERFATCSVEAMAHSITAFHNFLISSEKLEKAFIGRLQNCDFQSMELKYLSKFAFVIGNLMPPDQSTNELLEVMGKAVIRGKILFDPYDAVRTMVGLSLYGMYPEHLVDFCLSPSMQEAAVSKSLSVDVRRNLLYLDQSVRLENPGYHGNMLSEEFINAVLKEDLMRWSESDDTPDFLSKRDSFLLDMSIVLGEMFDEQSVLPRIVLPQFEVKDIVMCFNDGMPEPLQQMEVPHVSKGIQGMVEYQNRLIDERPNHQWVVFCLHSMNSFYVVVEEDRSEMYRLAGFYLARERQYRKKGYTVIPIKDYEFIAAKDKVKFLQDAINKESRLKQIKIGQK